MDESLMYFCWKEKKQDPEGRTKKLNNVLKRKKLSRECTTVEEFFGRR